MWKPSNRGLNLKEVSIKRILFVSFIIILLSTVVGIAYMTYSSWMNSINDTVKKTVKVLNEQIINEIDRFIRDAKRLNVANQELLEKGIIDINNEKDREMFFVNALNSFDGDGIYSFSYGTEEGEYYGARKNENNIIEIMKNNSETGGHSWYYAVAEDKTAGELVIDAGQFDCRTRAWYKAAQQINKMVFSPVYKHFILEDLAVSSSVPVYSKDGKLQGVLGSHINLSRINHYLERIVKQENAYAIIVEKESGKLIANSFNSLNFKKKADGAFERLSVSDMGPEVIQEAYKNYRLTGVDNDQFDGEKGQLHIQLREYQDEGLDWIIITALSDYLMVSSVNDNMIKALMLTILALFIASVIFLRLTKRYIGPINSLIQTQEIFANGDLSKRAIIVRHDEIGMVADSFNMMADTIYELINTLEEKVEERTVALNRTNRFLAENKDQLQLILDSTAEGIYGIDMNGQCTFINASAIKILGYHDQSELVGQNMHFLIHHSYKDGVVIPKEDCNIFKALTEGKGTHIKHEVFWKKDASSFSVEYHSYPQLLEGKIAGAVVTFMDNTECKEMEQMVFNEKEHFRTILLSVGDGVIATDSQGMITVINPVAEKLTGWSQEEAYGKPLEEVLVLTKELNNEICANPAKEVLETGNVIEMANHTMLVSKTKDKISIEDSAAPIKDKEGNMTGVVIVFRDFTEKKERLKEIEYLSMHDHLTGLYNRWYMEDAMKRLDTERNLPLTMMVIDVNGLKLVNDAFGHKMGDKLLKAVGKILKNIFRSEDIIGRIGGDEFLILLPKMDRIQAEVIKKRVLKAASAEKLDSLIVSMAIGYAVKNNKNESLEKTRVLADNQMYKDKLVYGKTMRSQTIEKVLLNINFKYDQEQIHTERVSQYCESIAVALNFSEEEIQSIKTAGVLHDIGKIIVPPELLNKTGKLTAGEFEIIKNHPETGYQILKSVDEYAKLAENVLYHHEYWNGQGYPQGLKGEKIPLNARIIAVADAYEAMTAKRGYQRTKSKDEAIAELKKCAGTQFDPYIVNVFVEKVLI